MATTFSEIFTDPGSWPAQDAVLRSTSISAEVTLLAYRHGLFPMPIGEPGRQPWMWWWSPVRRGVLPLDGLRVSRSLRKSARRFHVTVDAAFDEVLSRCADPRRDGGWIDARIGAVYAELHRRGVVHSVESWTADGRLAGGLYGVSMGGLFAGESMFHDPEIGRDASKVALVGLVERLRAAGTPERRLLDVQWRTDHLATLGAVEIPRAEYLTRLRAALPLTEPDWGRPERGARRAGTA
ncbi:leucyl/phenylalanyl-tRNA--protein transferase [Propionicicella superfundia]|uniref:leucyl/phenylalanyl-tRNA--protein transferase n=1 Tax=Propionicicella superfundia TaxID=348582 RepID=UPI0004040EDE|nr:leucyl/phenylalanyl-tRNA--protein transferase [Propionicicella superfundia]